MAQLRWLSLVGVTVLALAGCGGDKKSEEGDGSGETQAACTGSALTTAPKLPTTFPTFESVTYTQQSTQGPTQIVEGYYEGDVAGAHDEVKAAFERVGYTILFDELEEHDSEVSWKGQGRSGQVGLREECGDSDRTYVRITNRPQ
jgi:ABC-type glycerol-3-phosphate transport system substrate-binding protein